MLNFRMNMPFYLMALYGSIMIVIVLLLRALLKNRLPKFVFPVLWSVILLRFIIPFSLSSPLSMPVPSNPFWSDELFAHEAATLAEGTYVLSNTSMNTQDTMDSIGVSSEMSETVVSEEAFQGDSTDNWFSVFLSWQNILPIAYMLGIAAVAGILGWQKYGYFKRLKKGFLIEHNETVNAMLRSMDMGHVLVFSNDEIAFPLVCGLLNPRIYLPTQMDFGNTGLLRHILAHETMHIKRKDNWLKCVMLLVICLNWYNPLVWIMSKCLASDLEAACDEAVLRQCGEDERKDYAFSLLAMASSGSRITLLYSAFSKTEVEKRIKSIIHYKRATIFVLLFSVMFMAGSMVVFATGGQAPFSEYLSSYCSSSNSHWGVKATITRDIALGENPQERADDVILSVLAADDTGNPEVINDKVREALADEFGVEKGAFRLEVSLILSREELEAEYAVWNITRGEDGFWTYQGERVRTYEDKMLGSYQSREEGAVDISVQRNKLGEIISVTAWRKGDKEFDYRTEKIEQYRLRSYNSATNEDVEYAAIAE